MVVCCCAEGEGGSDSASLDCIRFVDQCREFGELIGKIAEDYICNEMSWIGENMRAGVLTSVEVSRCRTIPRRLKPGSSERICRHD